MAVSNGAKALRCPGCGARCTVGFKRLLRHMRNQCASERTRLQYGGTAKRRRFTNGNTFRDGQSAASKVASRLREEAATRFEKARRFVGSIFHARA